MPPVRRNILLLVGPGVLVAATGVGAGDLAGAAVAGRKLGLAVLWAVVVGALVKFVLNEQLARWQLATGSTILEGAVSKLGRVVWVVFGIYLVVWSPFVAVALVKACGAVLHAMVPAIDARVGAIGCSLAGLALVWLGGFALFQRVMAACIGIMFLVVVVGALAAAPAPLAVASGMVPRVPGGDDALGWTIALVGGVGGTLTIICYGYWMREVGRAGPAELRTCRFDLAIGYAMTAIFGIGMVVLAAGLARDGSLDGSGSALIVAIADRVGERTHPAMRWAFLVGAFGAVFSSVLGVWQAVPYVFADWWAMRRAPTTGRERAAISTKSDSYRGYLVALAIMPIGLLYLNFETAQKLYGIIGAAFIPLLAIALVPLMNRRRWIGRDLANRWASNIALGIALLVCAVAAAHAIAGKLG